MQAALSTPLLLLFAFLVAIWCGYGLVSFLMPQEYRQYQLMAMPTTGYLAFCLLTVVVSGNFGLSVTIAVWLAFASLSIVTAYALLRENKLRALSAVLKQLPTSVAVLVPTILVILWPLLYQGAELYLGSVNLDFFQSLIFQVILRQHDLSVFSEYALPVGNASTEWAARAWPVTNQARFGGVMFSYLLESLTFMSAKSSLTVAIATFALCVPWSIFFFSRVVFGSTERVAICSGVLAGVSAPVALGFMFTLVGQGSAMPVLPLALAILYACLTAPSIRTSVYSAILIWGLFLLYAAMLPFVFAPMGLLAVYLLARRTLSPLYALRLAAAVIVVGVVVWGGMVADLRGFLSGLSQISTALSGTVFFVDFLTEMFFVYLFGVTSYTSGSSVFYWLVSQHAYGGSGWKYALTVAFMLVVFVAASSTAWWRRQEVHARRICVASICVVYTVVWAYFTFAHPYGYSVFKMAMWFQFLLLPIIAYGLAWLWSAPTGRYSQLAARSAATLFGTLFVVTNLAASVDYGRLSFGDNRQRGFIANTFGHGGNPDIASLRASIAPLVSPEQTIGLGFTDTLQNHWAAYGLLGGGQATCDEPCSTGR